MKASLNNLAIHNRKRTGDLIGILLALTLGIGGQLFVLNPLRILTPKLPTLSQQDWPRSQVVQGLEISRNSPNWREFYIRMEIPKESSFELNANAYLWQKTSWYADWRQPIHTLKHEITFDFRDEQPIAESSLSEDKPASKLFCSDRSHRHSCTYFAYTDHWYTQVVMSSQGDEYLSHSEMLQIVDRVDQLLLAAPDKP